MSPSSLLAAFPFDVRPGEVGANLATVRAALEQAAAAGACLLLLPEKWTTSFLPRYEAEHLCASDAALNEVHQRAEALGMVVVGSAPSGGAEGEKPFNEVHFLGTGGDRRPYRKRLLFSPTGEGWQVRRGEGLPQVIDTACGRACAVVCYDLRFPELTRQAFYQDADLMLVPAQWPRPRCAVFDLLARARAAENQCYVLACNRAGRAGLDGRHLMEFPGTARLFDPLGDEVASLCDGSLLLAELDLDLVATVRRQVPCARDLREAGLWPQSEGGSA